MPNCNYFNEDRIFQYGGMNLNLRGVAECSLAPQEDSELCILHNDSAEKDVGVFNTALSAALMNANGDNTFSALIGIVFPREFTFYSLWNCSQGRWSRIECLQFKYGRFYGNPFENFKNIEKLERGWRGLNSIDLDGSVFERTIDLSCPNNCEFNLYFSRCRFDDSLRVENGDNNFRVRLTDVEIQNNLSLNDLSAEVVFSPVYYSEVRRVSNIGNLNISGRIKSQLNIRDLKIRELLSIQNSNFQKSFVFEQIENKSIKVEKSYFENAKSSFVNKMNFEGAFFENTNFLDASFRNINWGYKHIFLNGPFPVIESTSNQYTDERELENNYRAFRLNYQNCGSQRDSSDFHYREMHENYKRKSCLYKLFHWNSIYGHLSCWGNSVSRSVLVYFLIMSLFFYFYVACFGLFEISPKPPEIDGLKEVFYSAVFSFKNSFLLRPKFLVPQHPIAELAIGMQMVLSALQLFMITISMRRRIKF